MDENEESAEEANQEIGIDLKLILLVLTAHALVMLTALIPEASYIKRLIFPAINKYSSTTRSNHKWAMFENVPNVRKFDVVIEATDAEGNVHEFGPILPGLEPYSGSSHQRSFFALFIFPIYSTSLAQYLEAMGRALQDQGDLDLVTFTIRQDVYPIGLLSTLRETKKFPDVTHNRYGPYSVENPLVPLEAPGGDGEAGESGDDPVAPDAEEELAAAALEDPNQ